MVQTNLVSHKNYDGERLEKLIKALKIIDKVINSEEFKRKVLEFTTDGKLTFSFKKTLFKELEHYTNEEVYGMIVQAHEETGNVESGKIDLYLELIEKQASTAIGYGIPGDETIFTYSSWFDENDEKGVANHIIHEWCHKIGFDHAFFAWQDKNRDHSVPYAIGDLVEQLANKPSAN